MTFLVYVSFFGARMKHPVEHVQHIHTQYSIKLKSLLSAAAAAANKAAAAIDRYRCDRTV
jgi:hypothetical protein